MNRERRAELKRAYRERKRTMGVFAIGNTQNGKQFVSSAIDEESTMTRHRLELDFGSHRNEALQRDWKTDGGEHFTFTVLDTLEYDETEHNRCVRDLAELESLWLERLRPYGDRGYNRPATGKGE